MDKISLVNLSSRVWTLKALALIADGCLPRLSPLAAAAGCGRSAMTASIQHLVALGLLEKNDGHGHPMRPEFRLTTRGSHVAVWAQQLDHILVKPDDHTLIRNKWTLPVIACLGEEQRFSALRRKLSPVTDRALSGNLSLLVRSKWASRTVMSENAPPLVKYRAMGTGTEVLQHLNRLQLYSSSGSA